MKNQIKALKDNLLQEIISDPTLSKVEKLVEISENKFWQPSWCIENPFEKYENDFRNKVASTPEFIAKNGKYINGKGNPNSVHLDAFFEMREYDRHQRINLAHIAEDVENGDDDSEDEDSEIKNKVVIYRSNDGNKLEITREEFIDCIYEWCLEHKHVEFEFDW